VPTLPFRLAIPYRRIYSGEPLRPLLRVRLEYGNTSLDAYALVDSGADRTTFSTRHAAALGVDLSAASPTRARGVGGSDVVFPVDLVVTAQGVRFAAQLNFSPQWTTAFGLLGRADFFRAFRVAFDEPDEMLYLDRFDEPGT